MRRVKMHQRFRRKGENAMRHIIQAFALAVCLSCDAAGLAFSQAYPARPVRMVVPFPPGALPTLSAASLCKGCQNMWASQ